MLDVTQDTEQDQDYRPTASCSESEPQPGLDGSDTLVWKFILTPGHTALPMPRGARLLHVHEQDGEVCLWAECNPDAEHGLRKVLVVPTGGRVHGVGYVGTAHLMHGRLVFHVYDGGDLDPSNGGPSLSTEQPGEAL